MSLCGGNLHLLPAQPSVCSSQERRAWGLRTSRPSAEVIRGQRGPCHSSLEPQLLSTGGHTTVTSVTFVHTDKSQCCTPSLLINTPASPLRSASARLCDLQLPPECTAARWALRKIRCILSCTLINVSLRCWKAAVQRY